MNEIAKLQEKLLIMFKELKQILDVNKIDYFAMGGTAIGAFREKGFIKWDDDIDIAIKEEDVPRLLELLKNSKFKTINSRLNYNPYPFIKVFDESITISERGEIQPLFIDVFIVEKKKAFTKHEWRSHEFWKFVLYCKSRKLKNFDWKTKKARYLSFWLMGRLFFMFPPKYASSSMSMIRKKAKIDESVDKNILYTYHKNNRDCYEVKNIFEIQFEDTLIKVLPSFAKDTEWVFGDIMKKPSEGQVYNHNIYIVEKAQ